MNFMLKEREEASQNHKSSTGRARLTMYCENVICGVLSLSVFSQVLSVSGLDCELMVPVLVTIWSVSSLSLSLSPSLLASLNLWASYLSQHNSQHPSTSPPHLPAGSLWTIWNTHTCTWLWTKSTSYCKMRKDCGNPVKICISTFRFYKVCELL